MEKFKNEYLKMVTFAQNKEDLLICDLLADKVGTFLSLGENDGINLSNVRALALRGWSGVCVEPCEAPFKKLSNLYKDTNVHCFQFAIGTENKECDFFESGKIDVFETTGLVSSLDINQLVKWGGATTFETKTINCLDFKTFLELSPYKKFEMISIDCENMDYQILEQIDLNELGVEVLIVESNSMEDEKYIAHCAKFGLKLFHKNLENLLFCK